MLYLILSFLEFCRFKGDNDTNATELSSQSEKCKISAEKIVETQMRNTNCIWDMARPKRGEAEVKQMRSVYSYQKSLKKLCFFPAGALRRRLSKWHLRTTSPMNTASSVGLRVKSTVFLASPDALEVIVVTYLLSPLLTH